MATTNGNMDTVVDDSQPVPLTGKRKREAEDEEEACSKNTSTGNALNGNPNTIDEFCSNILEVLIPYVLLKVTHQLLC